MLFGVRFAQNEALKDSMLQQYMAWKNKALADAVQSGLMSIADLKSDPNVIISPSGKATLDFKTPKKLLSETDCTHYMITKSVVELCKKIRVKEPFELEWLQPIADGKRQLNFGNTFIRYDKQGEIINAVAVDETILPTKNRHLKYSFFNFNLATQAVSAPAFDDFDPSPVATYQNFDDYAKKLLYQLIIFMELAEIKEVIVEPGRKHGKKRDEDNLLNESRFRIIVVNTAWNRIIRTTGFDVDGYFKKQHYGKGNKLRTLVWIDPYHKEGYNLGARGRPARKREFRGNPNSKGYKI